MERAFFKILLMSGRVKIVGMPEPSGRCARGSKAVFSIEPNRTDVKGIMRHATRVSVEERLELIT